MLIAPFSFLSNFAASHDTSAQYTALQPPLPSTTQDPRMCATNTDRTPHLHLLGTADNFEPLQYFASLDPRLPHSKFCYSSVASTLAFQTMHPKHPSSPATCVQQNLLQTSLQQLLTAKLQSSLWLAPLRSRHILPALDFYLRPYNILQSSPLRAKVLQIVLPAPDYHHQQCRYQSPTFFL